MAWENGIQVPFPFFFFAWHWKTDLNFVFRFRITFKNGCEFRFNFVFHFCITFFSLRGQSEWWTPPAPNDMAYPHGTSFFITMDDKWYDDSREKTRSYRNTCIPSMEKENDEYLKTLQHEVTKCEIKKITNEVLQSSGVSVEWLNHYKVSFLSSFPGYNKLLHHKLLNNWATWTGKNKTRLVNFSYKWHKKCVQDLNKTGLS